MGKEESAVSDDIRDFLKRKGFMVFRMQSGKARVKGQWITLNPTGTPDLLAIDVKNGFKAIFIETKRPKDSETSLEQKRFQEAYTASGGISVNVNSLGDFLQKVTIL